MIRTQLNPVQAASLLDSSAAGSRYPFTRTAPGDVFGTLRARNHRARNPIAAFAPVYCWPSFPKLADAAIPAMSEQTPGCAEPARFFILNLGRCGSSLLSAVLADAGAQFGLPVPAGWDPRTGQMESPAIKRAAHHYRRAHDISEGRKFVLSPMLEQKFRLQRARQALRDALAVSRYVKIGDLDLVVQPAFKLGYEPVVILNYRQLEPMLPSLLAGRTHVGPDELAREYVRIYRQGLMLLDTFGGCTVEFNDLLDPGAQSWATALAGVTGLDAERLLEARARHLRGEPDPENVTALYTEAHALLALMRARRGLRIPRARQVQRAIDARR